MINYSCSINSVPLRPDEIEKGMSSVYLIEIIIGHIKRSIRSEDCSFEKIKETIIDMLIVDGLKEYQARRAIEYPSLADQLDALWKGGADLDDMKSKVQAVKSKHAKN